MPGPSLVRSDRRAAEEGPALAAMDWKEDGLSTTKRVLGFLAGLCLILSGSVPARSQGMVPEAPTDARMEDAMAYAEEFGTGLEEALRRLELQDRVGLLDELLEVEAEKTFGGLWMEHQPEFRVVALFTRPGEGRVLLSEAALGDLASLVEVRPAAVTLAQLRARLEETRQRVQSAGAAADLWINVRRNRVEVLTPDPRALHSALTAKGAALPPATAVVEVESLLQPSADLRGGRPIADFSTFTACTAGFAVRSSTGRLGLSTAGHCDDNQTYEDTFTPLFFRGGRFRGSHDVQWHSVGCNDTIRNEIDTGVGIREINGSVSRSAQAVGTFLCKFGRSSGHTCGAIDGKSVCPSYVPSCNKTFICVRAASGPIELPGDSGGPWFRDNRAYGIHSGGDRTLRAIYMAVDYMGSQGYSVLNYRAGVIPYPHITCSADALGFSCYASGRNGTPPYTFSNWSYFGPATTWSGGGTNASGTYDFLGCPEGAYNSISVQVRDACGRTGTSSVQFFCPEASCGEFFCEDLP